MSLPTYHFDGTSLPAGTVDESTGACTVTVGGGQLQLNVGATGRVRWRSTTPRFSLVDGARLAFDNPVMADNTGGAFGLRPLTGDGPAWLFITPGLNFAAVRAQNWINNTAATSVARARFNAIERSGSNILYRTSPDGTTWTTVHTEPVSAFGDLSDVELIIDANSDGTARVHTLDAIIGTSGSPPLVANAFRVVAGTLDLDNIPVGVPVDFEVEVIDTTQGNARVTSFTGEVTLAAVAPFPDGLVVVSGDTSNPAVAGVATFTAIVFANGTTPPPPPPPPPAGALAPPSLAIGTAVVTALEVAIPLTIAGPASWPAGVVVQRQTRRGVGAWTALGSPVAPGTGTITFAREQGPFTVQLRGIAQAGGTPADSDPSAELTIAVPALASVPVLASVTPLVCDVALFPGSPAPITAAAGGVREELAARAESDNLLVVSNVRRARQRDAHELKAMTMRIDGPSGVLLEDAFNTAGNPSEFTRGISREAFALSRGTLTLTLTLTAQDDSITTIELALPQGVS